MKINKKKVPSKQFKGNVNHFHFPFLLSQHCIKLFTVNIGKEVESTLGGTSNNNVSNYPLCIAILVFIHTVTSKIESTLSQLTFPSTLPHLRLHPVTSENTSTLSHLRIHPMSHLRLHQHCNTWDCIHTAISFKSSLTE